MGVCCIKGNHHLNDFDNSHRNRHNKTLLINKTLSINHNSIFTTQNKSGLSHSNNNGSITQKNKNLNPSNELINLFDSENKFFTYFAYSSKVQTLVTQCIRVKRMGQNYKLNQNNQSQKNQTQKAINATNEENMVQGYIHDSKDKEQIKFLIEEGKKYLDQLKCLMEGSFTVQLQKFQILKSDLTISNSTLRKMLQQIYSFFLIDSQNNSENSLYLIKRIKKDLLNILIAQLAQEIQIPGKVLPLNISIKNFQDSSNKSNPEDEIITRPNPNSQFFYLIKFQMNNLKFISQTNHQNVSKILITLIQPNLNTKTQNQIELVSIDIKSLVSHKDRNQNILNQPYSLQFFITSNTIIKFKTHPFQSSFSLHAPEFLKFVYINQAFSFVTKPIKSASNHKNSTNNQLTPKIQPIAAINLNMQIFSSDWKDSLGRLKLQTKNIVKELESIEKGEDTWDHLNSLRSSFASVSENESSFISNFDSGAFCC